MNWEDVYGKVLFFEDNGRHVAEFILMEKESRVRTVDPTYECWRKYILVYSLEDQNIRRTTFWSDMPYFFLNDKGERVSFIPYIEEEC